MLFPESFQFFFSMKCILFGSLYLSSYLFRQCKRQRFIIRFQHQVKVSIAQFPIDQPDIIIRFPTMIILLGCLGKFFDGVPKAPFIPFDI